jgi:hypothetical protein
VFLDGKGQCVAFREARGLLVVGIASSLERALTTVARVR